MKDGKDQVHSGTETPGNDIKINKGETSQFPDQDTKVKVTARQGKHSDYQEGRLLSFDKFVSNNKEKFSKNTIEKDAMDGVKAGDDNHDTLDDKDKTVHNTKAIKENEIKEKQFPDGPETPENGKGTKETTGLEKTDQYPSGVCKTHLLLNFKDFVKPNFDKHGNTKMKGKSETLKTPLNIKENEEHNEE